ncbi:NADH dehydrogenase [ubiquinone] 1 beta subcomplex subunit 4 [Macaca thibetana thibetana]|uniref:NADH dehydrogenase [ubiquinone] 1 beta subcomplex subunit 4 n=1 Tax=Macaca thibetana thibetana TaxID=257877 RepID=UPI0021BC65F7|nr:NADH dehydrogenase [ubiquinone] 1 beta subcomplex subunit 4 [Macaca thibetana thibetana]XP_050637860.1 NADH dehydrogenase [ubiquinone] 1 beta subcomplex subunit 4 [Macaca thibetana thibetana]XP_050637861.1 NADH dehydrogenase [ubiquinone] 1 beta subcomplex subunit 4 [Macaca thibetana thibetana]XP_050637862.1 NADH dehydrogenase [ubiquinone] 1 beta subcomplex subunit 4 [Macaca thibetana thibetana]
MSTSKYKPSHLATLPETLDPAEYDTSLETRRAQAERLAIRARLKREYLLQYNDPNRRGLIENPALLRWTYARINVYPNFRPTPKNSLLGALFGIGPLIFLYCIIKADRDKKEKLIREGKLDRTFQLSC